jgi:hypothetical protein
MFWKRTNRIDWGCRVVMAALERAQCRVPSGWHAAVSITVRKSGEVVAQVPNCLAFPLRLAHPRLGREIINAKSGNRGAFHRAGWACVKSSDITPAYVSPVMYQAYTCPQLAQEAQAVSTRAASLSGVQDQKRTNDGLATAAAVVIFWPAAFFVGGDKQTAAELAQMKGQMVAIEQAANAKKCGIQFQGQRPPGT